LKGQLKGTWSAALVMRWQESKIAALDLASNYDELGKFTRSKLSDDFKVYGLT
jgi:hypothetical protein